MINKVIQFVPNERQDDNVQVHDTILDYKELVKIIVHVIIIII